MSDSPRLDKLVSVSPRFARSVSLVRDAHRADALEGYILTPTGRDVLRRLSESLRGEKSTRAWSITGPYGSGKSAFALLVAQLLSGEQKVRQEARAYLASSDAELAERFFGAGGPLAKRTVRLCPVLVTGSRQPLEKALAASLAAALRPFASRGRPPQIIEKLESAAARPSTTGTAIVGLFEEANEYLDRFGGDGNGLLLIVDELGKFLEYGAINPEQGDVFVLQELAEAATRSERPFLFMTILHQSIDRYADHMSPGRRAEWAKVQGRFEDVAFEERAEQLLRLLSHAISVDGTHADLRALRRQGKALAQDSVALGIRVGSMDANDLQQCLAACYPLHPLTALTLGPLFRQLAQNERSLFAFLASSEPFGFQEFLRDHTVKDPYRLDRLYDYVMASLGPTLFAQHRGKLWAEVQSALDRLHDASELEVQIAKSIGLIQALGSASGVAKAKGHNLHDLECPVWYLDLPQLDSVQDIQELKNLIQQDGLEVLFLDPAYLCLEIGEGASNLFLMGQRLRILSEMTQNTGCTIILATHTKKYTSDSKNPFASLELEDIAWSGFAEWSRQWLLVGRRERFDPESAGTHKLWLSAGGSAGHHGLWAVDVTEGRRDDAGGRRWEVGVYAGAEAMRQADDDEAARKESKRSRQAEATVARNRRRVLETLKGLGSAGGTKTQIRGGKISGEALEPILQGLLQEGLAEACEVKSGNQTYPGYRLKSMEKSDSTCGPDNPDKS